MPHHRFFGEWPRGSSVQGVSSILPGGGGKGGVAPLSYPQWIEAEIEPLSWHQPVMTTLSPSRQGG